ncbi:MAG TPA: response regulator [Patescibacteria group bacterium]|nr:response regulator [Patescibacteria group bacterium]
MKKIVIIEDELAYLKLLHEQLALKGYQIIEAHDGMEGLEIIKREKPDLVLLDIRMPKMDGMTMLDLLRKEEIGETMKVIFLTNLEADEKITEKVVEELPLYYFVKSDTDLDKLISKIDEVIN